MPRFRVYRRKRSRDRRERSIQVQKNDRSLRSRLRQGIKLCHLPERNTMSTTRRSFIGTVGVAASAAAMTGAAKQATAASGSRFFVAAITPCDTSGKFDEALYRELMPFFKEHGVDGILVLGSTGEFPSFSVAERKRIAETALKHRSGLEVMVQVGTPNLPETLDLLSHAASNGADCVLCIPPFYFKKPAVEGLTEHYSRVLE